MLPQAKDHLWPQKLGETPAWILPQHHQRKHSPTDTLISDFYPPEL